MCWDFLLSSFQPPLVEKQVVPRRRCWGHFLAKVMPAAAHRIYCDKWRNIQSTPLLEGSPSSSSLFRRRPTGGEIVCSDVLSWHL